MDRRQFMASAGVVALAATLPSCATVTPQSEDARLRAMLDRFFYDGLKESPESATSASLDTGERANLRFLLSDYSEAARGRDLARSRRELASLRSIDRARLSESAALDYDVVEYSLNRSIAAGQSFTFGGVGGRFTPYVVSQLTGPYRGVPDFLDNSHPIETRSDAEAYLARLSALPRVLDQSSDRLREDAARGVIAPDYILDTTLRQMRSLRDQPAGRHQLVNSVRDRAAAKGIAGDWGADAEKIVAGSVFPALDRQIALVTDLRRRAGHDAGVSFPAHSRRCPRHGSRRGACLSSSRRAPPALITTARRSIIRGRQSTISTCATRSIGPNSACAPSPTMKQRRATTSR
jgi:uncharacterized protein (DUF885 family)